MSEQLDFATLDDHLAGLCDAPHWYVGYSGGVDSTVLLHLLRRWCKANPDAPSLTAIHVNHGIQAQAQDWQLHCEWLCRLLQIPIISCRVDVSVAGRGLEAAAREARYHLFEQQLQAGDVLFLAHHLDDQVETFFLRLMRGAGVQGLAAMSPRRPLGEGRLARPLLQTARAELEDYALRHGLECVEDPSNSDTALDRNFLRAELLPLLSSRWPGYRQTVARASEHMAGTARALEQLLPSPDTLYSVMGDPGMALQELTTVSPEFSAVKLRSWLQAQGCQMPDRVSLEEFLRQLRDSGEQTRPRLRCSSYALERYRDGIYLLPANGADQPQPFSLTPGEIRQVPGVGRVALQRASGEGLHLAENERLQLAWRTGGERCKPQGRAGSASLKKLLQEQDIPPWWRDRVPLLYLGDELLAVGDLWCCESSRWRGPAQGGESLWQLNWLPNMDTAFN